MSAPRQSSEATNRMRPPGPVRVTAHWGSSSGSAGSRDPADPSSRTRVHLWARSKNVHWSATGKLMVSICTILSRRGSTQVSIIRACSSVIISPMPG
uniref:ORF32 n=1 Tax=Latid herpesvirus 1 TaxID=3096545 RepID=A0AB33V931_9VIRU